MRVLKMLFVLFIIGGLVYWGLSASSKANKLQEDLAPKSVTVVDQGVFVPLSAVNSVFGDAQVRVHTSPPDVDTAGAKSVDADGVTHVWVPTTFYGGVSSLTPSEAQEYVLRQLARCDGECVLNTDQAGLDANVLQEMAADQSVKRTEPSDMLDTFILADTFKYALDKQAQVAEHGMDKIAEVARSGDAAQTAMSVSDNMGDAFVGVAAIAGVLLLLYLWMRGSRESSE